MSKFCSVCASKTILGQLPAILKQVTILQIIFWSLGKNLHEILVIFSQADTILLQILFSPRQRLSESTFFQQSMRYIYVLMFDKSPFNGFSSCFSEGDKAVEAFNQFWLFTLSLVSVCFLHFAILFVLCKLENGSVRKSFSNYHYRLMCYCMGRVSRVYPIFIIIACVWKVTLHKISLSFYLSTVSVNYQLTETMWFHFTFQSGLHFGRWLICARKPSRTNLTDK